MKTHTKITFGIITVLTYLLIYFPILVIMLLSVNKSSNSFEFTEFSFKWYLEIFHKKDLLTAIINTLTIAVLSTIIATVVGTIVAIGINSLSKKNRVRIMILSNVPVINPDIVTGISLMLVFSLLPISFGMSTMLMAHVFFSIPFVVLTVLPKLKELDTDIFNAALDLGCNYFQAIYKVIIPSIKTAIIAGSLIAFTMSIDDFVISYFTTGNGYNNFSIWLYSALQRSTLNPASYAYNTIVVVFSICVLGYINLNNRKSKVKRRNLK
jgi:spermidine/putrescine transport system permease protein